MSINIRDLKIDSPAFGGHGGIPGKHTGEGEDVSPEIRWNGVPDGTRQLALVCHDPDAPLPHGFTHWVVYGIPADADGIREGGGGQFTEGANDFGNRGYNGPMPPEGHGTHHYYFWVYALSRGIDAGPGMTRAELLDEIGDQVVEQARTIGTYKR